MDISQVAGSQQVTKMNWEVWGASLPLMAGVGEDGHSFIIYFQQELSPWQGCPYPKVRPTLL